MYFYYYRTCGTLICYGTHNIMRPKMQLFKSNEQGKMANALKSPKQREL